MVSPFERLQDPAFSQVEAYRIELAAPLLILKAPLGILACGYLNVQTMNRLGEVGAIVTGVRSYEDMLQAQVLSVSEAGAQMGITTDHTGREALAILCR